LTVARAAAVAAIVLAIAVLAIVLIGGAATREYVLYFQNAGQLVQGNDVQIAGQRVGNVTGIELTRDNQARITVVVQEPYAPLREGTQAVIRATSLSGVANRYIALTPGPDSAKELADGAALRQDSTRSIVDLDQLFATFDPETRKSLQGVMKGFATQFQGKERQANAAAEYFNPLLSTSRRLFGQLGQDEQALSGFLVNTGRAMTALASRREALTSLVTNANTATRAIAAEDAALTRSLELLPTTLRRANTTFVNLRSTLDDLDELVAESGPATRRLAPFLRELRPLVADARPTIRDLRTLVTQPGPGNDALDATRRLPRLRQVGTPAFRQQTRALAKLQEPLEFIRPYTPELTGWVRSFGQATSAYDANGHYARVQPIFNSFAFQDDPAGGVLEPQPLSDKFRGMQTGLLQRCPGAASQPAADGSAPFLDGSNLADGDCDPRQVPPGP
jgi:phospholipid/cholesterol/gamma-HCH transport system substrate-binding protein